MPWGLRVPINPSFCLYFSDTFSFVFLGSFVCPGARLSKVPRTFRDQKAIRKITTCLFCKAGLFICCKGNKNKNNWKVSCLETPSFWRCKENYVTQMRPKSFGTFEKQAPGRPEDVAFCTSIVCSSHDMTSPFPLEFAYRFHDVSYFVFFSPIHWDVLRSRIVIFCMILFWALCIVLSFSL